MWPEANRDELKSDDEEVEKPVNSFEKFCSEGELRNEVVAGRWLRKHGRLVCFAL